MKNEIIWVVWAIMLVISPAFAQKDGYCKSFKIRSVVSNEPNEISAFTVPARKRFVLSSVYISSHNFRGDWALSANRNLSIHGCIWLSNNIYDPAPCRFDVFQFPIDTAVIKAGETLVVSGVSRYVNQDSITITVVGYLESLPGCPISDLTGDCKVDMADLAKFASEWLT